MGDIGRGQVGYGIASITDFKYFDCYFDVYLFVGVIKAVIVSVADPGLGDAVAGAGARELEVGAGPLLARVSWVTRLRYTN